MKSLLMQELTLIQGTMVLSSPTVGTHSVVYSYPYYLVYLIDELLLLTSSFMFTKYT